ncbi:MAG: hypothetical protein H5U38_13655 [Calditrichaeota bacterium]|nr:hypothetical protein [Calditrichota bacterium]
MEESQALCRVEVTEFRLRLARALRPGETPQLRGFFGQRFIEEVLLHHHLADGSLLYTYPRVQFKIVDTTGLLVGVAEGSSLLSKLWLDVEETIIGTEQLPVLEASIHRRLDVLGDTTDPVDYRFVTPWLALNQDNARRYWRLPSRAQRVALLERILVGNCLSLAKSFGHTVRRTLRGDCRELEEMHCTLKGVPMIGFLGTFRINFLVPNHFGLGKSVSRGFGTVEQIAGERHRRDTCSSRT